MARPVYVRPTSDFERVGNFSDAVIAIAMTLLVVGIGVPRLADPSQLGDSLRELKPEIISFFIGFGVIGFYWRDHHTLFSRLRAVDPGFINLNLCYLAAIAFVPFPTGLIGSYEDEAVAFVLYAVTLAVASSVSALMFAWALKRDLFLVTLPAGTLGWGLLAQLVPAIVFVASIPVAMAWSTTAALFGWLVIIPLEALIDRIEPAAVRDEGDYRRAPVPPEEQP